jgi:cell division protein FtsW (lipid II flippase)
MMSGSQPRWYDWHWPLVGLVLTVCSFGIYNLHSSAAATHDPDLYLTQLLWLGLGVLVAAAIIVPDYRFFESVTYAAFAAVCLALVAVLVQGKVSGGARRWLLIGSYQLQPSEFAKIATVLCLARYFAHREDAEPLSLGGLCRPLNPTRPVALLVLLASQWSQDWMQDPVGQLARLLQAQPTAVIEETWWFRLLLCWTILAALAASVWIARVLEQSSALLNPWPPERRRRVWIGCAVTALFFLWTLWRNWTSDFLQDPVDAIVAALQRGDYATLRPQWWPRVALGTAALAYLWLSVRALGKPSLDALVAPADLLLVPFCLTLVQPDLGTAGSILLIGMSIILMVGVRLRSLLSMAVLGAGLAGVAWFGLLKTYQKQRILTFMDPEHDLKGAGWNAVQSMIAVGSGQWWGKGHRNGTQSQLSFLPEQHTDFAFSVWAEEQGFVGCFALLAVYVFLLLFALRIAQTAREPFGALVATGIAAMLGWHSIINVSMVVGLLPVVGLPLPLFSYGGSSVLTTMAGVGLLLSVDRRSRV